MYISCFKLYILLQQKLVKVSMTLLALREAWSRGIKLKVRKIGGRDKTLYVLELYGGVSCLEYLAKFSIFLRSPSACENTHRNPL